MYSSAISTNSISSPPPQVRALSETPEPFKITDLVQQIFHYLSLQDLGNFELVCRSHRQSTSHAWHLFQAEKGFLYDWISPPFQGNFSCVKEKRNYFLCQSLEKLMSALPKKQDIVQTSQKLRHFFEKYPIFHAFTEEISTLSQKMASVKEINGVKRVLGCSAEPCPQYKKEERIFYALFKIYNFIKSDMHVKDEVPETAPTEILNLASEVISKGATFISRLAITLIQRHRPFRHAYCDHGFRKYRPFLHVLALKAEAHHDSSGRERLFQYILQQCPLPSPTNLIERCEYLLCTKFYRNLSENEKQICTVNLNQLKEGLGTPDWWAHMRYTSTKNFELFIEAEEYLTAETIFDHHIFSQKNKLEPKILLLAIQLKIHLGKYKEATDLYDYLSKKKGTTPVKSNLDLLIKISEAYVQLKNYDKVHTYLMKYWNKQEWHEYIFVGSNNRRWEMDSMDAFQNEEFQTLIEWTIAIKGEIKDQEGAEYFRNLLQLTHINLEDTQGYLAANREWKRQGFYLKNLDFLPLLLNEKKLLVQLKAQEVLLHQLKAEKKTLLQVIIQKGSHANDLIEQLLLTSQKPNTLTAQYFKKE